MKFDGTSWVNVGTANFSAGLAYYISLAFSPSGEPYVAYNDEQFYPNGKATVMKFNGSSWVNVGAAGFSAGVSDFESLAFSPSGEPYVAFEDCGNGYGVTLMKYDSVFVGINEPQKSGLSLYPNPASNQVTIETSVTPTQSQLSIMNLSGQQLITSQITEPKIQIDISTLPSGVYFMRLTGERTVKVGKIIKQ